MSRTAMPMLFLTALLFSSCATPDRKKVVAEVPSLYSAASPTFRQATGSLLGGNFIGGNRITSLVNGREIFPAMLSAIHAAKKTIDFETYIFWDGEIGKQFAAALSERARAGVKVNVILDAQGSMKMGSENAELMRATGVQIEKYHSIAWLDPRRFNNRTHRKLLVVDGRVAFIGGVGIADEWLGDVRSAKEWRDNHYRVTGPVVAQIQALFMDNWLKTRGEVLNGPDYFPPLSPVGSTIAQAFKSSPRQGAMDLNLMYLLAIASAKKSLVIENAYFLPDDLIRQELIAAARRGVDVQILVPGTHIDQKAVRKAERKMWPGLLQAGIHAYEFDPAMVHVKLLIVDGTFVSIGSGNFDLRSLRLNDEANLNVLDRNFATSQRRLFELDKRRSHQIGSDQSGKLTLLDPTAQVSGALAPEL